MEARTGEMQRSGRWHGSRLVAALACLVTVLATLAAPSPARAAAARLILEPNRGPCRDEGATIVVRGVDFPPGESVLLVVRPGRSDNLYSSPAGRVAPDGTFSAPLRLLGCGPQTPEEQAVPGALQPFETGLMIWRGDQRRIFVLAGTELAGRLVVHTQGYSTEVTWPETWQEGENPGGGPGPSPGLYEPARGFGKLWREQEFRNLLGYATTPGERAFTMVIQEFAAGYLLAVEGPGGRATYAIYLQASGSHNVNRIGNYERVAGP